MNRYEIGTINTLNSLGLSYLLEIDPSTGRACAIYEAKYLIIKTLQDNNVAWSRVHLDLPGGPYIKVEI
jgi:hypothetical protein